MTNIILRFYLEIILPNSLILYWFKPEIIRVQTDINVYFRL
jgi:hypothetical protein